MNKKKGSAILVVIILTVTISIYISSAVSLSNNYKIVSDKYINTIKEYYSKDIDNLNEVYKNLESINKQ